MSEFKSGFVAVLGPTNVGKSTLVNALIGRKVSIVSKLEQTTYHSIRGILNAPEYQIIFTDTPGFQSAKGMIPKLLNKVADQQGFDSDINLWVFDVSLKNPAAIIQEYEQKIKKLSKGVTFCVLNKVDKIEKTSLLPLLQQIHDWNLFNEIIPVSAMKNYGVKSITDSILKHLPEGPALFPVDKCTDRPEDFLMGEFIREKIYHATYQEIPYSVYVEIETMDLECEIPKIHASLHVDSDSRKGILMREKAKVVKWIGTQARKDIESMLGKKVFLKLNVDVAERWKDNSTFVNRYLELN
jgi:GTP-binding protein Era